jgi:hypothetical protein
VVVEVVQQVLAAELVVAELVETQAQPQELLTQVEEAVVVVAVTRALKGAQVLLL